MSRDAPGLKRIVRTAERLFARDGYDGVSVAAVARVAGVSKATVFHHFPRKIDLYRTIFSAAAGEFRERMIPQLDFAHGLHEGIRRFVRARAQGHRRGNAAARLVMRDMAEGSARLKSALRGADVAASYSSIERKLSDAQQRGLIRADVDCAMGAQLLIMASGSLFQLSSQLAQRGRVHTSDVDRFADTLADLLAHGLNNEQARPRRPESRRD